MLLLFSVRVVECPTVWEIAVYAVYRAFLEKTFISVSVCLCVCVCVCVCDFFSFGFEGGMWDLLVYVPDHCLSVYLETFIVY